MFSRICKIESLAVTPFRAFALRLMVKIAYCRRAIVAIMDVDDMKGKIRAQSAWYRGLAFGPIDSDKRTMGYLTVKVNGSLQYQGNNMFHPRIQVSARTTPRAAVTRLYSATSGVSIVHE
jgi:hypothetical protein